MTERVSLEVEAGVAHVLLNRPDKRNALDLEMFLAIVAMQKKIRSMRGIRVVILQGKGEDFCSGLDVQSMMSNRQAMIRLLWKWLPWQANTAQKVGVGWRRLPVPVIAAIHGRCWGGGLQLAMGADFRMVQKQASLSIMEGRWGLIPDMGGTLALRELMGRDQATRIAMTAETLTAGQALELGLATEICEDPMANSAELAKAICERSPDAVSAVKKLYRKSWNGSEGSALARETIYQIRVLAGANQRIAVRRQQGKDTPFLP
jgi:enoyl-CoA hydratase/carnithine racemase